jgi:hypothetical protein
VNQPLTVDDIENACNTALAALGKVITQIEAEADRAKPGPHRDQLEMRSEDLMDERRAIRAAADKAILSLPGVIAAAANLDRLSADMMATAQELPNATGSLGKVTALLSLGQQFNDIIAKARST